MNIQDNLPRILQQIAMRSAEYNRPKNSVSLLAVSKKHPSSAIKLAFELGQRDFGENYLQEAIEKITELQTLEINWHFIGAIQSNKTKEIAQNFSWVHTVNRLKIAEKLNRYATVKMNVCVQVNISLEKNKSGCDPDEVLELATKIQQLPNLKLRGLMTIPKKFKDFNQQMNEFNKLKKIFDELNQKNFQLDTLSMGMSQDLVAAIATGSTMVRVGQKIFGARI